MAGTESIKWEDEDYDPVVDTLVDAPEDRQSARTRLLGACSSEYDTVKEERRQPCHLRVKEEPRCLIRSDASGNGFLIERDVADELMMIEGPVSVVAITGLYRTGKSFLMNRLAGKKGGFPLGSTVESKTKGIWVWVIPHPFLKYQNIMLMDTEGLGDTDKGDSEHDGWLFILAVLLSSVLIYNILGVVNEDMITNLNHITEITKKIKIKQDLRGSTENVTDLTFPLLVFALRDFTLILRKNNREISSDEYLEDLLKTKPEGGSNYNRCRECIKTYFKRRKCFTFDRPVWGRSSLQNLENISDEMLSEDFRAEEKTFIDYIFRECKPKVIAEGLQLTCKVFVQLATEYIYAIRNNVTPCIQRAHELVVKAQNEELYESCKTMYDNIMSDNIVLPTADEESLESCHNKATFEVYAYFTKHVIDDRHNKYREQVQIVLQESYSQFQNENKKLSLKRCSDFLKKSGTEMKRKLAEGRYARINGHQAYLKDLEHVRTSFFAAKGLGVSRKSTWEDYMFYREAERFHIMRIDELLTEAERRNDKVSADLRRSLEDQIRMHEKSENHYQDKIKALAEASEKMQNKYKKDIERLEKESEELRKSKQEIQELHDALEKEKATLEEIGKRQKSEIVVLKKKLSQTKESHETLNKTLDEKDKELKNLNEENEALTRSKQELEVRCYELSGAKSRLEDMVRRLKTKIESLDRTREGLEKETEELRKSKQVEQPVQNYLVADKAILSEKEKDYKSPTEAPKEKLSELEESYPSLHMTPGGNAWSQKNWNDLKGAKCKLEERVRQLNFQINSMAKEVADLEQDLNQPGQTLAEKDRNLHKINNLKSEKSRLEEIVRPLKRKFKSMEKELSDMEKDQHLLDKSLGEKDRDLKNLNDLRSKKCGLEGKMKELNIKIESMEKEVSDIETSQNNLLGQDAGEMDIHLKSLNAFKREKSRLEESVRQLNFKIQSMEKEILEKGQNVLVQIPGESDVEMKQMHDEDELLKPEKVLQRQRDGLKIHKDDLDESDDQLLLPKKQPLQEPTQLVTSMVSSSVNLDTADSEENRKMPLDFVKKDPLGLTETGKTTTQGVEVEIQFFILTNHAHVSLKLGEEPVRTQIDINSKTHLGFMRRKLTVPYGETRTFHYAYLLGKRGSRMFRSLEVDGKRKIYYQLDFLPKMEKAMWSGYLKDGTALDKCVKTILPTLENPIQDTVITRIVSMARCTQTIFDEAFMTKFNTEVSAFISEMINLNQPSTCTTPVDKLRNSMAVVATANRIPDKLSKESLHHLYESFIFGEEEVKEIESVYAQFDVIPNRQRSQSLREYDFGEELMVFFKSQCARKDVRATYCIPHLHFLKGYIKPFEKGPMYQGTSSWWGTGGIEKEMMILKDAFSDEKNTRFVKDMCRKLEVMFQADRLLPHTLIKLLSAKHLQMDECIAGFSTEDALEMAVHLDEEMRTDLLGIILEKHSSELKTTGDSLGSSTLAGTYDFSSENSGSTTTTWKWLPQWIRNMRGKEPRKKALVTMFEVLTSVLGCTGINEVEKENIWHLVHLEIEELVDEMACEEKVMVYAYLRRKGRKGESHMFDCIRSSTLKAARETSMKTSGSPKAIDPQDALLVFNDLLKPEEDETSILSQMLHIKGFAEAFAWERACEGRQFQDWLPHFKRGKQALWDASETLHSGNMTLTLGKLLTSCSEEFLSCLRVSRNLKNVDGTRKLIAESKGLIDQFEDISTLVSYCQNFEVTIEVDDDYTRVDHSNLPMEALRRKATLHQIPSGMESTLRNLKKMKSSSIFEYFWREVGRKIFQSKLQNEDSYSIFDDLVMESAKATAEQAVVVMDNELGQFTKGTITLADVNAMFSMLPDAKLQKEILTLLNKEEKCLQDMRIEQVQAAGLINTVAVKAKVFMEMKTCLGLKGDFSTVHTIFETSRSMETSSLEVLTTPVILVINSLNEIPEEHMTFLNVFVTCWPLLEWIRDMSDEADAASDSSTQYGSVGKSIPHLQDIKTGFSPLIYELDILSSFKTTLDVCQKTWGNLGEDPELSTKCMDAYKVALQNGIIKALDSGWNPIGH